MEAMKQLSGDGNGYNDAPSEPERYLFFKGPCEYESWVTGILYEEAIAASIIWKKKRGGGDTDKETSTDVVRCEGK